MILVGQYDSPYVRRVGVTLHVLAMPYERNLLSVFGQAEAMRRINPLGRIPALVLDDGEVLIDSAAMLDHLDEVAGPARALLASSGPQRRNELKLMAVATGVIDKAMAIAYEFLLRPRETMHAPFVERNRTQLQSALLALEQAAPADGWFNAAAGPRQPDITVACALGYVRLRAPEVGRLSPTPRLDRLSARAEALPEFADCLPSIANIGGPEAEAKAALDRLRVVGLKT